MYRSLSKKNWPLSRLGTVFLLLFSLWLTQGCTKSSKIDTTGKKVLNAALGSDIKGFDPIHASDQYSHVAVAQVYQGLMQYKYLARPYDVEPCLAETEPEISKDGLNYKFTLRPDVFFHPDEAFEGKARKLVASDVVYSFKRLADPRTKSPMWWVFEGKIEGLDEFREKIRKLKGPVKYEDHAVSGLQAPDNRTVVIKLKQKFRQLLFVLAMAPTRVVAREVVEKYGDEFLNHPVGTGPFILKEWRRGQRIDLVRNPKYWEEKFPSQGTDEDRKKGLLRAQGKKLPFVDEVRVWIYVESQPRWLNFLKGNLDLGGIPKDAYDTVFDEEMNIKPDITRRKIVVEKSESADVVFWSFNLEDPLLGDNPLLRKAISAAMNRQEKISLFYNNRAIEAHSIVPPGIFGYDETLKNPYTYNLEKAKKLVSQAKAAYKNNTGKSEFPSITYDIVSSTVSRQMAESSIRDLLNVGLKLEMRVGTWPQFQERMAKSQGQVFGYAWNADYPDPENFLQLLYSKNASPGPNHANFRNKEYDRLYEGMRNMEDTPKRKQMIRRMIEIIHEEVPIALFSHRIAYPAYHAWLRNYKGHAIANESFKYLDVDLEAKKATFPLLK